MAHILYVSQTGLAEPLGRSQVIPYLRVLAESGHRFTVLSFERESGFTADGEQVVRSLLPQGTRWLRCRYHRRPPLISTALDIVYGILRAILVPDIDLIHARSTVAALIGYVVALTRRRPWVFDVRGFLAQEYIDAGHWARNSFRARLTSWVEGALILRASGLVFLAAGALHYLTEKGLGPPRVPTEIIPCAIDLVRFSFSPEDRKRRRGDLALGDEPLLIYVGSLGSWYLLDHMLEFAAVASEIAPGLSLLLLTADVELAVRRLADHPPRLKVQARAAPPEDVPGWLSAADGALCLIAPKPSKRASSPTKLGEYLGVGLPVVANTGVGDVDAYAQLSSSIILTDLSFDGFREAAERLVARFGRESARRDARALAELLFALPPAAQKYGRLYSRLLPPGRPQPPIPSPPD